MLEPRVTAAAAAGPDPGAPGAWVRASFRAASRQISVWYFFPTLDQAAAVRGKETFKAMAACLLRGAISSLAASTRTAPAAPQIAADGGPEKPRECICLSVSISLGPGRLPCRALVGRDDIAFLHAALHARGEPPARASGGPPHALEHLLCMSHDLLARRRAVFFRDFTGGEAGEFFPVSLFLELVTERDRAVALQNRILLSTGSREFRRLFRYTSPDPERKAGPVVVTPFAFDEQGLLAVLPEKARGDWARGAAADPGTRDGYEELNRGVLEDLWKAARRKSILVSPRAAFVLDRMVMPGIRARAVREIEEARAAGIPFEAIRGLRRPLIQRLFARASNRTLCLAMVGEESRLALVSRNVSVARASALSEDLAAAKRLFQQGGVEPREILESMRKLHSVAKQLLEEDKDESIDRRGTSSAAESRHR